MNIKIPKEWKLEEIGEICQLRRGLSWNKEDESNKPEKGIPILRITNIQDKLLLDDLKYLKNVSEDNRIKYKVAKGDSIMVGSNGSKERIGNCCYVDKEMVFAFASFLLACKANEGIVDKFLFYTLRSYPIQTAISHDAATSTGLHNISLKFLRRRKTLLPPLLEQQRIVEILSTVDDVIEKTEAIIEETKQLKMGLMQKLFSEGIGHTRFKETKIGRIPYEWKVELLKDITPKFLNGGTPSTQINEYWNGEIPWITGRDVTETVLVPNRRFITQAGLENSSTNLIPKGSIIVVTRTGVGKISLAGCDIAISQDITGIVLNERIADNIFYLWYLKRYASKYISIAQGTTIGGILRKDVERTIVPLPPIEEQRKIAQILYEVDSKIEKEKTTKEQLGKLKKGLMQVLLTGKIRVKV